MISPVCLIESSYNWQIPHWFDLFCTIKWSNGSTWNSRVWLFRSAVCLTLVILRWHRPLSENYIFKLILSWKWNAKMIGPKNSDSPGANAIRMFVNVKVIMLIIGLYSTYYFSHCIKVNIWCPGISTSSCLMFLTVLHRPCPSSWIAFLFCIHTENKLKHERHSLKSG